MPGTELEERVAGLPAVSAEDEAALAAQIQGEVDQSDIVIPQLKLAQGTTEEVKKGTAEAGDFINALTGESFGTELEFLVADQFKGRFWSKDDGEGRGAQGDVVPWADHPCAGQHFADCDDAEEQYAAAVNRGDKDWGKGPGISTTFNFVGFVVSEGNSSSVPVRLSLMRTNVPAARKLQTFISRLSKAPWSKVYKMSSKSNTRGRNTYHTVDVEVARDASVTEQRVAVALAQQIRSAPAAVEYRESPEGGKPAPAAEREGALEV